MAFNQEENLNQEEQSGALGALADGGDSGAEGELPPDPAESGEDDEFSGMTEQERERAVKLGYKPKASLRPTQKWKHPADYLQEQEEKLAAQSDRRKSERLLLEQSQLIKEMREELASFRNGFTQERDSDRKATLESAIVAARGAIRAAAQDGDLDRVDELTEKLTGYQESLVTLKVKEGGRAKEADRAKKETETRQAAPQYSLDEQTEIEAFRNRYSKFLNNPATAQAITNYQGMQEHAAYVEYQSGTLSPGETPLTRSLKLTENFIKSMYPESAPAAKKPPANVSGGVGSNVRPAGKATYGTVEGLTTEGRRQYDEVKADLGEKGAAIMLKRMADANPSMFREQRR